MTRRLRAQVRAGTLVPALVPRVAVVAVSCLAFALVPLPAALVAVALSVAAALVPTSLGAWGAALVIGAGQLAHPASVGDWRIYAALAVVHLLHVLGGFAMFVDPRGMMQLRTLRRPLQRWLWIQLPAQALLVVVLAVPRPALESDGGVLAVVAGVCLCAVAAIVVRLATPRR